MQLHALFRHFSSYSDLDLNSRETIASVWAHGKSFDCKVVSLLVLANGAGQIILPVWVVKIEIILILNNRIYLRVCLSHCCLRLSLSLSLSGSLRWYHCTKWNNSPFWNICPLEKYYFIAQSYFMITSYYTVDMLHVYVCMHINGCFSRRANVRNTAPPKYS